MKHKQIQTPESETTRRILEAAAQVFAEVGFSGARVDVIADRAGINKAALYYHIGGKDTLYIEVIRHLLGDAPDRAIQNIQEAASPEEKLRRYVRNVAQLVDHHPSIAPIMLREVASGGQHMSEFIMRILLRLVHTLSSVLEEGEQQGVFIRTSPLIVHLMIIGPMVISKVKGSIMAQREDLAELLKNVEKNSPSNMADEVESLIVRSVKKSDNGSME
jgi:TetR/AcrR family transcriptional regulator